MMILFSVPVHAVFLYDHWYFESSQDHMPLDVYGNTTYFWILGDSNDRISRYLANGTYDSWNFAPSRDAFNTRFTFNGTYFWVAGQQNMKISRYLANGTYDSWNFSVQSPFISNSQITGLDFNGTHFFIVSQSNVNYQSYITIYNSSGNYITNLSVNDAGSVRTNNTYIWQGSGGNLRRRFMNGTLDVSITQNNTPPFGSYSVGNGFYRNTSDYFFFTDDRYTNYGDGGWVYQYLKYDDDKLINNCSYSFPYNSKTITFVGNNEETKNVMNYSQDITLDFKNSFLTTDLNNSFQFRNQTNYSICLAPLWTTYFVNSTSKYYATGFSERYYYLENATLSNSSQNITLYLLNSSSSTLITMVIKDQVENPVENEIVLVQKQDLGTGTYIQVAEAESDFSGYAYIYLKLHENYKFFLTKNGIVQREFEPMQLESTTLTFYVSQVDVPEYFSYYDNVATSCTNVSNNLTCNWIDTSGLTADMTLYVGKIDQVGETTVCDYTNSSSSGTFICDLSGGGNFRYVLKGTYHSTPITYVWQSGFIGGTSVVDFGVVGLVLTLLIVMFVAYMTHNDVKLCLVSTAFAIIFCSVISLIRLGTDAMAMSFTVGIISGIIAFKIRY